jgi:hypothetical protein
MSFEACPKNCVNNHNVEKNQRRDYGNGTKENAKREGHYRPITR